MPEALIGAAAVVAVAAIFCFAALKAWRSWLELKRAELDSRRDRAAADETDVGVRIELAGVKERVRKLEAIASGVDP